MADLAAAENLLHTVFGFAEFRAGQAEIIDTILSGRDVLAVMPTGSGKSLCYQLPALLRDGLTIVVSPLIALMRNQVAQLRSYGIAAASLNSTNDFDENRTILEQIARGELRPGATNAYELAAGIEIGIILPGFVLLAFRVASALVDV